MPMSLAEYKRRFPDRPPPVPAEYSGQWLAWNEDHTQILAHGKDWREAHSQAVATGCSQPILQKVLPAGYIGRT